MKRLKNKLLIPHLPQIFSRLSKSTLFLKNFVLLFSIISLMFLAFAYFTYQQSLDALEQETLSSCEKSLDAYAEAIDTNMKELRHIYATLETNPMINSFFNNPLSEILYNDLSGQIQDMLLYYVQGYSSIDSIYLYAGRNDYILTDTFLDTLSSTFRDFDWVAQAVAEQTNNLQYIFRAKYDSYPYLLSIMKTLDSGSYQSSIIINVDLKNNSIIKEFNNNHQQEIFIVSDESKILYRNKQEGVQKPLETVSELQHFQTKENVYTCLSSRGSIAYAYSQVHSNSYPWSYVTITYLDDYDSQLLSAKLLIASLASILLFAAISLSILFSYRAVKPIHGLLTFLEEPSQLLSDQFFKDSEIQYIADNIISSIQLNQTLADELDKRLHLLNETKMIALQSQINPHFLFNTLNMIHIQECMALGYDHDVPKLTLGLSELLRYAIGSTDLVEFETELKYTKLYISILKARYQNLQVIYDIDDDTFHAKVPKLFMQPLIENAVFHGLAKAMNPNSTLTLSCHAKDGFCHVSVMDNGKGIHADTLERLRKLLEDTNPPKSSIGLKNVFIRMNLLYKEQFTAEIDSTEGKGSTFTLHFPLT